MDHRPRALIAAAALLCCGIANAGYAQLTAPAQWVANTYQAASNEAWVAQTVRTTASLNVGGRAVLVPAAMRMAANAPVFAARAVFLNPALAVASVALLAWAVSGGFQWDAVNAKWNKVDTSIPVSDGNRYTSSYICGSYAMVPAFSEASAMASMVAAINSYGGVPCGSAKAPVDQATECHYSTFPTVRCSTAAVPNRYSYPVSRVAYPACPAGYYVVAGVCQATAPGVPATQQQFEDGLASKVLPDVPGNILPFPLPMETPIVNPNTGNVAQPFEVSQGLPQPIANTSPQQYKEPILKVQPANNPDRPWQVDVQPADKVSTSSTPTADPNKNPVADTTSTRTPKDSDLCVANPNILACATLDTPDQADLTSRTIEATITPDSGWGASSSACPPPKTFIMIGQTISVPYDLFCTYMAGMRPIILAMAWLSAAMILVGAREGD